MNKSKKHFLLIGGGGFIGTNLARALLNNGHQVRIVERLEFTGQSSICPLHLVSLSETRLLIELVKEYEIDTVIHLASGLLPGSGFNEYQKEYERIILPTQRLLEELDVEKCRFIFYSSGGTVYGRSVNQALNEDQRLEPINHYGQSKLILEESIRYAHRTRGLSYGIFRPSNPYGPGQNLHGSQGFIAVALGKLLEGTRLELWGDGSTIRDFVYIDDLVNACASLCELESINTAVNIGQGCGTSLNQILSMIARVAGRPVDVAYGPQRTVDIPVMILDISRLKNLVSYNPRPTDEGICKFYEYLTRA